jgi:hypothetical protein
MNSELVEEFAKLSIKDNTGILYSCSNGLEGGHTPPYTSKPMLLSTLRGLEPSRITGRSFAIRSAEPSWVVDSSASLFGVDISSLLSMRWRLVKAKTKKGRLNTKTNLTIEEIDPVASGLITDDSIPFFINNYNSIVM